MENRHSANPRVLRQLRTWHSTPISWRRRSSSAVFLQTGLRNCLDTAGRLFETTARIVSAATRTWSQRMIRIAAELFRLTPMTPSM
jgi:hypothetical protein